jgi:hypothetical protein
MATVSDITTTPLSGYNWIDALLDSGPDWNYLTPAGNTLQYTFSVTTGNEAGKTGQEAFTLAQQNWLRYALNELSSITGVKFAETTDGNAAQIHFANINIADSAVTGLCSWSSNYGYNQQTNELTSYSADAYVYLDNSEWYAQNRDLTPGGYGYETLLHELGHAMGLKHSFLEPSDPAGTIVLPSGQDNTANTLMSYTHAGGPYQHYSPYDVAALNWLYGGDGLRGALGINSTTGAHYITGTNNADTLVATASNDTLDGGAGTDTAVFHGARSGYSITQMGDGSLVVADGRGVDGTDTLKNIEILQFSDVSVQRAQLGVPAPSLAVAVNANGYAAGSTPHITGAAQANTTVNVYYGNQLVGSTKVDSSGIWTLDTNPFPDGMHYSVYATATDAAGNTSGASAPVTFNIDAHAPGIPTGGMDSLVQGGNLASFHGTAEAGTEILLVNYLTQAEMASTVVAANGGWSINTDALPNGNYSVSVVAIDAADNATSAAQRIDFTINSQLNATGDAGANTFTPGAGNNAIDGQGGLDVAVYAAPSTNFQVHKQVMGYSVQDMAGGGTDTLVNVERIQFGDNKWLALDINGEAGQVYRIYQAAFDRTPDAGGFAYWLNAMDKGMSLDEVANLFMQSKEAADLYTAADPSDAFFVNQLYQHVLHREPDAAGLAWWMDNVHKLTRAQVLETFSESPENQAQVIGTIKNGIEYTPWHG